MVVLITGGTGFLGQALVEKLVLNHYTIYILTRQDDTSTYINSPLISYIHDLDDALKISHVDILINLAGEPIADKRWSVKQKQIILESRMAATRLCLQYITQSEKKPKVFISGSAIGYYGPEVSNEPLAESSSFVDGFQHDICNKWESLARQADRRGVRTCIIRTGVVLGDGGALDKMVLPFKMGLGGKMGHGQQWMSWVHIEDWVGIVMYLLKHDELSGTFNGTAPTPVTNRAFSEILGRVLRRPAFFTVPGWLLSLLMGESSELVLTGQRVIPQKLLETDFSFRYPELEEALVNLKENKII